MCLTAPYNQIRIIDLSDNRIGDAGGVRLAEILMVNKNLRKINLMNNNIKSTAATG